MSEIVEPSKCQDCVGHSLSAGSKRYLASSTMAVQMMNIKKKIPRMAHYQVGTLV